MGFNAAKTRFRGKTAYRMMAASCALVYAYLTLPSYLVLVNILAAV
jgi:hypothetical protein